MILREFEFIFHLIKISKRLVCLLFFFHAYIFCCISDVSISEASVAIYVSGAHRRDCLDAVSFLIEQLKANVPIWKKVTFFLSSSSYILMFNSIMFLGILQGS
jgi:molybdopterin synthase catalytic subunit